MGLSTIPQHISPPPHLCLSSPDIRSLRTTHIISHSLMPFFSGYPSRLHNPHHISFTHAVHLRIPLHPTLRLASLQSCAFHLHVPVQAAQHVIVLLHTCAFLLRISVQTAHYVSPPPHLIHVIALLRTPNHYSEDRICNFSKTGQNVFILNKTIFKY